MHLKSENIIQELKNYKNLQHSVLSVYLGQDGKKSPSNTLLLSQFHSLVYKKMTKKEKNLFSKDIKKIDSYLKDDLDTRGSRSVVIFTSGENLWKVLNFEFYLDNSYTIGKSPYLKPIEKALKDYRKFLVLLVDRAKARIFTVHLGIIEERTDVFDKSVPQKVRANEQDYYGRSDKILRHIEDHLHRHLQLIAKATSDFAKDKYFSFMILGGHKPLFAKIRKLLPKTLSDKVSGTFVTELNIPLNNVFIKSKEVAGKINNDKVLKKYG